MTQSLLVVSEAVARVAVEVAVAVDGLGEVIVGSTVTAGDAVVLVIWGAARWIVRISTDLKEAGQNYTKSMPGGLKSSTFGLLNCPPPHPAPHPPVGFISALETSSFFSARSDSTCVTYSRLARG